VLQKSPGDDLLGERREGGGGGGGRARGGAFSFPPMTRECFAFLV